MPTRTCKSQTCRHCQRSKSLDCFHVDRAALTGRRRICRTCAVEERLRHRERMNLATCGLYTVFGGMKQRCYDTNASNYPRYGGRGITICAEWLASPPAFYAWALANGYRAGMQIDRIDPDRGYAPGNCQIITARENAARRRSPRKCA